MINKDNIERKMNELYPHRKGNLFKDGKESAITIVETLMSQGFMDCIRFIFEESKPTTQK